MKKLFFLLITISFLISCNNSSDYKGKWRLDLLRLSNNELDYPTNIFIGNDSIKFNYWAFDHSHKFPLKIEKKKLLFNNWKISLSKIGDTIVIKENLYVKDENDSIFNWWWGKPITKINLPKIKTVNFSSDNYQDKDYPKYHVLFGKRLDNNEFSLQLNNKYAEMQDLGRFFFECIIPNPEVIKFPKSALYIEKMTPMKFVEDIFYNLKIVNQPKVSLINNINLNYNDSIGLYYEYELLNKKLPPIYENDNYSTNTSKTPGLPPPPPPPYSPIFGSQNLKSKFILLKQDNIYFNDKIISTTQLKSIVKPWIKNNNVIFSLYDLESTYGKFLEMNAVINSVYQEVRGSQSKLMYNKTLKELNRKEDNEIKSQNPMRHIWSYSIPHYNSAFEQNNSFFGLKVNKKM